MTTQDLQKQVVQWAVKIGRKQALIRLLTAGLSPRAAEKLIVGSYQNCISLDTAHAVIEEMKKDHIKAS